MRTTENYWDPYDQVGQEDLFQLGEKSFKLGTSGESCYSLKRMHGRSKAAFSGEHDGEGRFPFLTKSG